MTVEKSVKIFLTSILSISSSFSCGVPYNLVRVGMWQSNCAMWLSDCARSRYHQIIRHCPLYTYLWLVPNPGFHPPGDAGATVSISPPSLTQYARLCSASFAYTALNRLHILLRLPSGSVFFSGAWFCFHMVSVRFLLSFLIFLIFNAWWRGFRRHNYYVVACEQIKMRTKTVPMAGLAPWPSHISPTT